MSTAATLLLTWSLWWLFVVPDSVPARRSFFQPLPDVPQLVAEASEFAKNTRQSFVYSLAGGWPTLNTALRVTATLIAMISSLSFAFIATLTREKTTRSVFAIALFIVSGFALSAAITDSITLHRIGEECDQEKCQTAIPDDLGEDLKAIQDQLVCECSPDAGFWVTLAMDYVMTVSAITCLGITIVPWFSKQRLDESMASSM